MFQATDNFTIEATAIRNQSEVGNANIVNISSIDNSKYFKLIPALEDRQNLSTSTERTYDYEVYNISASYDFGFSTLLSSTTKYDIDADDGAQTTAVRIAPPFHILESDLLGTLVYLRKDTHAYGQEIRLSGDTDTLNWTVGILYSDTEVISSTANTAFWLNDNLDIFSPAFAPNPFNSTTFTNESVAVFSDASYSLTDQLTVSLGARYYEDKVGTDFSTKSVNNNFENLSLKGALSYALSDQANLYFTIAEEFRSGGINFNAYPYDPESLISYEFGGKAILVDGKFSVDASV